jgi:hypothetical protein
MGYDRVKRKAINGRKYMQHIEVSSVNIQRRE